MNLRLRERREALGLNQKELAQKVGKSFRTIQSWEREESYPNAELVGALCEVFNTDPNDLLGWYEEHPEDKPAAPSGAEGELIDCYRQSTEKRRSKILETARDQAELSQNQAAVPEIEGLEADQVRSA